MHREPARGLATGGRRWTTQWAAASPPTRHDGSPSTIHRTYESYFSSSSSRQRGTGTVKFRCERDVLTDALGTCGRAASSRSGALPVLTGLRAELPGNQLTLTGTDLELTIAVEVEVAGERDGLAVIPARLANDVV